MMTEKEALVGIATVVINVFLLWVNWRTARAAMLSAETTASPENSWRVPIPVQTQEPPCGTSAVLTTTCATTEALA